MANIREYTNKVDIQPDDRGMQALNRSAGALGSEAQSAETAAKAEGSAFASIGQSLGSSISTVGGLYDQYKTHQEVSRAGPVLAYMQNQFDQQWQGWLKNNDPADPTTRQRFLDTVVQPAMAKFNEGFSTEEGQAWGASQTKATLDHQYAKTAADQMTLAGSEAVQQRQVFANQQVASVTQDPTDANYALVSKQLDDYHDFTVGHNPSLDAASQAQLQTHLTNDHRSLAYGQVQGKMLNNPEQGIKDVENGDYDTKYLTRTDLEPLLQFGRKLISDNNAGARAAAEALKLQQKTDADDALKGQMARVTWNPDGSSNIPPDFISNITKLAVSMPGMDAEKMKTYSDWAQSQIEKANKPDKVVTDLPTYAAAVQAITSGQYTPGQLTQEIIKAANNGHLSNSDTKELVNKANGPTEERQAMKDQNDYIKSLTPFIDHTIFGVNNDPEGSQRAYLFRKYAEDTFKAQGDTPAARETIRQAAGTYALDNKTAMRNIQAGANMNAPARTPINPTTLHAAPARAPGETAAAYLKRTGH